MIGYKYRVLFSCSKCGQRLETIGFAEELPAKLNKVSCLACPGCGEEPCELWRLVGIAIWMPPLGQY